MSLTLKSIELSNIRSHKHVVFEPSEEGVTAISGPNGSGKSTLVDSVAWTLYGSKPQGVARAASIMREGTDLTTEKAYSRVILHLDGVLLKVERRIVNKHGAVECDIWEKQEEDDDWVHQAGPAISHAEPFIRKRLKMDEKGFLAAVLVQQKQVDQLISATPRERAEVIEKLTGIASITAALVEARQQYNSLKKVLSITSLDEEEVKLLKEEVKQDKLTLQKREEEKATAQERHGKASKSEQELREQVQEAEEAEERTQKLKDRLVEVTASLATLEESLARLTTMKDAKKKQLTASGKNSNIKQVEAKLQEVRQEVRGKERLQDQLQRKLEENKAQANAYQEVIEKSSVKTLEEAEEGLKRFQKREEDCLQKREELGELLAGYASEVKKLEAAVRVLEKHEGNCPTCLQKVEDPAHAVAALEEEKATVQAQQEETRTQRKKTEAAAARAAEGVEKFSSLVESLSSHEKLALLIDDDEKKLLLVEGELKVLEQEVKVAEDLYNNARRFADLQSEYESLLANAVEVSDKLEKGGALKLKIEAELKERAESKGGGLPTLRKKLTSATDEKQAAFEKLAELREEVSLLQVSIKHKEENVQKGEEEVKRYHDLMKSVEVAGTTTETLEEFRENRIRNSVPIVGAYASDLLNRFTDGRFTHLKLDEKFNATVVLSTGGERPVGLLSGGELSAAAISLRLAISLLLNSGSSSNMLILDEVLVSQDATRAEQILSTIKEVCQGQVVMISHGPYTNEIADKVVEL